MLKRSHLGLILLLVAIAGWFGVIDTQLKSFSTNALQTKVLSDEVNSYKQRISDLDSIQSQGSSVTSTLTALFLAMPKSSQVPEVLVMMEGLGSNSGVVFSDVGVGVPTGSAVPVTVSFAGSQSSVTTFLSALYNNIRTVTIQSQSITADQSGNLDVTMQLGFVYQGGTNANQ